MSSNSSTSRFILNRQGVLSDRVQAVLRVWPGPVTLVHGELAIVWTGPSVNRREDWNPAVTEPIPQAKLLISN